MAVSTDADAYAQGRQGIFFNASDNNTLEDGNLTGQCVSLVKWFLKEMTSVPRPEIARGHAKSYGDQLVAEGQADRVASPQRGDIVVWPADGGVYGHIGVVLSGGRVFEQNVGVAGTAKRVVYGLTVYAARISPLYANWRKGNPVFYRVRSYVENTTKQGEQLMIIQDAENWYGRCNKTHWQIRGRELDRANFLNFVGKDFLTFVEACSDDPEADAVQQYQTTGRVAVTDNWVNQIETLRGEVATLSKRPTTDQLDSLNAQIKTLTDSAAEAKAAAEKAAEQTPEAESIVQPSQPTVPVQEDPVSPVKPATPTEAMKSASLFVARIGSQIAAARIIAEGIAVSLNGQIAGLVSGSLVGWLTIAIAALLIFWAQFGYQLAQSAGWKWAANLKWPF